MHTVILLNLYHKTVSSDNPNKKNTDHPDNDCFTPRESGKKVPPP